MTTAKININGRGIVANVAKPRSKIANVYRPNLNVGKPTIKNPVGEILQDDIEVNITGILKGTGIADPTQFKYNKELIRSSDVASSLLDKYRLDNFGSFDYITNFFFEKLCPDLSTTSEEYKFSTSKVLLDYYDVDEERRLLVEKVVNETFSIPDELKSFVGKVLIDSSLSNDELSLSVEKIRSDSFNNLDIVTILWEVLREFSDLTTTSEETKFEASKILLDNGLSTDTPYKATTKVVMDTGSIDDLIKHVTWFRRNYFDHTYVTDDVLGEANVDDDQTAYVIKGLIESQELEDLSYFDVHTRYRSYIDSVTDVVNIELGRTIQDDLATMSTVVTKVIESVYNDPYYLFEETTIDTTKVLLDSNIFSQLVELSFEKDTREQSTVSDTNSIYIDKDPGTESLGFVDSIPIHIIAKVLVESQDLVETISKILSIILQAEQGYITDTVEKHFSRPVDTDTFGIQTDYVLLHPNKGINEVNVLSESGYMNKQDYFAQDYVTPGYSGTDYTF